MADFTDLPLQEECDKISLQELLAKLHRNDPVSPSMVTTIAKHASLLGNSICKDYKTLNAIIIRHEALIRKRWLKKSTSQRRAILIQAWPGMSESHRSDSLEVFSTRGKALRRSDSNPLPSDACSWPYINLEDLLKPRSLLIFLNARGRNVPLSFALSEDEFSPLARMSPCGPEPELVKYLTYLSRDPDPSQYGSTLIVEGDLKDYEDKESGWSYCMRPVLNVLYIQERILRFLVSCCKLILHDMSDDHLVSGDVLDEPPSSELDLQDNAGHITFADSLTVAPYRNRGAIDISRLRNYVESLATNAKDHLWALREDPSYVCDTLLELADHRPELIPDAKGRIHSSVDTINHKVTVVREMVGEAYQMLCIWEEMLRVLKELEMTSFGTSRDRFASLMTEFGCRASMACDVLSRMVHLYASAAPQIRQNYLRKDTVKNGREGFLISLEFGTSISTGELQAISVFDRFRHQQANSEQYPHKYHLLDILDMLMRKDEKVRALLSPKLATLITQLSLAMECAYQYSLSLDTPSSQGNDKNAKHDHDHNFQDWIRKIDDCHFPVHLIDPTRGKLRYPIHKAHNPTNIQTMRTAEANLDAFWDWVDAFFEQKTGVGQHDVIRQCMLEGGQMRRTPPWEVPMQGRQAIVVENFEYTYQPFSRIYHREELQITGAFNKMSVEEKIKPKTRGTPLPATEPMITLAPPETCEKKEITFPLDKRAHKAMKSLFHVATSDTGEYPKAVKWDEFKRAMVRLGFSAEKLQGSAWQFSPVSNKKVDRGIHFHEPHPDSDIPYIMARRFGRRLERVYGWNSDMFTLV